MYASDFLFFLFSISKFFQKSAPIAAANRNIVHETCHEHPQEHPGDDCVTNSSNYYTPTQNFRRFCKKIVLFFTTILRDFKKETEMTSSNEQIVTSSNVPEVTSYDRKWRHNDRNRCIRTGNRPLGPAQTLFPAHFSSHGIILFTIVVKFANLRYYKSGGLIL